MSTITSKLKSPLKGTEPKNSTERKKDLLQLSTKNLQELHDQVDVIRFSARENLQQLEVIKQLLIKRKSKKPLMSLEMFNQADIDDLFIPTEEVVKSSFNVSQSNQMNYFPEYFEGQIPLNQFFESGFDATDKHQKDTLISGENFDNALNEICDDTTNNTFISGQY
ncbi:hypothetical protein QTN25_007752 [Entamoeba marina]